MTIKEEVEFILGSIDECAEPEIREILVEHGYDEEGLYFIDNPSDELIKDMTKYVGGDVID